MREPQAGRPSEDRIREAVALGERVTSFVVACPKDVTMYDDAIKTTGSAGRLVLEELSELVAEACLMRADPAPPEPGAGDVSPDRGAGSAEGPGTESELA
jgi:hypothetical protein